MKHSSKAQTAKSLKETSLENSLYMLYIVHDTKSNKNGEILGTRL